MAAAVPTCLEDLELKTGFRGMGGGAGFIQVICDGTVEASEGLLTGSLLAKSRDPPLRAVV